jgi:hypothetical protein
MEFMILDTNLKAVSVLDAYESIIWTDRYNQCGDFEIYTNMSSETYNQLQQDYYLWSADSEHTMIIEDIEITSDAEEGSTLKVTGRSLESMLDRRIIWNQTTLTGKLQDGIKQLLNDNIISPTEANRKIDNFVFVESTDTAVTDLTIDAQYLGDNLYDVICELCSSNNIGFKIVLTDDLKFNFSLYAGADKSYDQLTNPYVLFSPDFDNIINSNYIESKKTLKNIVLVAGEESDSGTRTTITVEATDGAGSGLSRREYYSDASDLTTSTEDGGTLSTSEYEAQLKQRGNEELSNNSITKSFEGEMETTKTFVYGEDFFMGDIVQIANEFGIESKSRIIEMVMSQDESGIEAYPTFETV